MLPTSTITVLVRAGQSVFGWQRPSTIRMDPPQKGY
jgi:hypothetical protein